MACSSSMARFCLVAIVVVLAVAVPLVQANSNKHHAHTPVSAPVISPVAAPAISIASPPSAAAVSAPAPAPASAGDGTSIDQGVAYVLMLVALVLTYLIHPLDASSPYRLF